jgi:hypothetical protein
MKDAVKWSDEHRAGARRSWVIMDRKKNKPAISPGSVCIRYTQDQESARRRGQILAGRLRRENGLIPLFEGRMK